MRASIQRKEVEIQQFQEKLAKATSFVVIEYLGLTVGQITELRSVLRENNMEIKVYKNNITKRSTESIKSENLTNALVGPNAVVFSYEDPYKITKILHDFAKKNEVVKFKTGVIDGEVKTVEELEILATLPSKDELLATFAAMLNSPLLKFGIAVKEIAKQKEANGESSPSVEESTQENIEVQDETKE